MLKDSDTSELFVSLMKKQDLSEDDILNQINEERVMGENYIKDERDSIEADLILLRNQKKKKDKIWDTTLFNNHTALIARSYQNKTPVKFKWDRNWIEKTIRMINSTWEEDNQTPRMKALRYYEKWDKFATGISIIAKIGWDWVMKSNIFQVINPLLAVPDPNWDYFTWDYRFLWFYSIKTKNELKTEWYDVELLTSWETPKWAINTENKIKNINNYPSQEYKWLYEIYLHFFMIWDRKVWAIVWNAGKIMLTAWVIPPGNTLQKENPTSIKFPFAFKYWKPIRWTFFGDRPANYIRDIQINKAIIANLRMDKMRAELYPMYIYNKDYVSGKDLSFGFNKWIPVTTKLNGPVSLDSLIRPIQRDLKIDTSILVEQLMDKQVEKSTSIWEVVQWSTPSQRETLWTNQLIQTNTDVNLSLNEEIEMIWIEQMVQIWFSWYYENFAEADSKLIYAWSWTAQIPLKIKRKEFLYEWNLAISIENNIQIESRKRKQALSYQTMLPFILWNNSLNEASKREALRKAAEAWNLDEETIDLQLPKTSQQQLQSLENELLNDWEYIEINPDDDDEQHLVEMGSLILTPEAEMHQYAHIQASIKKWTRVQWEWMDQWMLNWMSNSAMAQINSEMSNNLIS